MEFTQPLTQINHNTTVMRALLRLFGAVQVPDTAVAHIFANDQLARMVRHGYVLDTAVPPYPMILDTIESEVGRDGEKLNRAFHKSWAVVRDSPIETLIVQQIVHYITTYGFESVGIYTNETVYIPHEKLEVPALKTNVPLKVIRAMTADEVTERILNLAGGVALAEETLHDVMTVLVANEEQTDPKRLIAQIANRELVTRLREHYGIVPEDPTEFLRYVIAKLTGESLLIKSNALIQKIEEADGRLLDELVEQAPADWASVFLRYKPLFLALRRISNKKSFFNRLRKQADKLHQPLPPDILNNVTAQIKERVLDEDELAQALERASLFRKIRLLYALHYRTQAADSIVYRVRNGRGWATEFEWPNDEKTQRRVRLAFAQVLSSIVDDLKTAVAGKTVYIPPFMNYALPATEKQYTGNVPTGSYVRMDGDMVVGIHWENSSRRVDLDLSTVDADGKVGWDAAYRRDGRILFSGDMTDATGGATELFYIAQHATPKVLLVNYFNFDANDPIEARLLVAHESPTVFERNYMVDVNNILGDETVTIDQKQNVLGLIGSVAGELRFYFANVNVGNQISGGGEIANQARRYFVNRFADAIDLAAVLELAGAVLVAERPSEGAFVSLHPNDIDKGTILGLMQGEAEG